MKQLDHILEFKEASEAATPFMAGVGSGSLEDLLARIECMVGAAKASKLGAAALRGEMTEMVLAHLCQDFDADLDEGGPDAADAAARWFLGTLKADRGLDRLVSLAERKLSERSRPREFSFAGMTDFISIEDVIQLLANGRHRGCLTIENADDRLDIYFNRGWLSFFDPFQMARIFPGSLPDRREIDPALLRKLHNRAEAESKPVSLLLLEEGIVLPEEFDHFHRELGTNAIFELLRLRTPCIFHYRPMAELPGYALVHSLEKPAMPILLEANKRLDEWDAMIRTGDVEVSLGVRSCRPTDL